MQDRLVLSRLDQIRALADPLRLRLVAALVPAERSVAGLARLVGAPATRLYHHVELLLAAGLIEERRRVPRRGVEERFYRASARRYTLDGSLLELSPGRDRSLDGLADLARSVLGGALESLTAGLREGRVVPTRRGTGMVLEDRVLRLGADGFAALARELPAWLDEFARRHGRPRGRGYQVAIAAFPAAPREGRHAG
jgi:DNA-binding transcriptional ArsR family regulator